jgi:type IV secretory pathway component VirB8
MPRSAVPAERRAVAADTAGVEELSEVVPGFVYTADLIKQAQRTEKFVEAQWRKTRRANIGWRLYSGMTTVLVFLLGGALNYALPLERLIPVFFYQKPDGITEWALTTDSLPADLSDANIKAWLWQYVRAFEDYSWTEADYNHLVVSAMSAVPVRASYDAWISGKNPASYLAHYGKRAVIRVGFREITNFAHATESQPGRITIHYDRQVDIEGEPRQPAETWSASLEFIQDYKTGLRMQDIRSFNPSRIVVTAYPGAVSLPPAPGGLGGPRP